MKPTGLIWVGALLASAAACSPSHWSFDGGVTVSSDPDRALIQEDQRRLHEGEPLKHHDDEEALRRHEFERDFHDWLRGERSHL